MPQSTSLRSYVEQRNFDMAYKVACLGVTETDWRDLGLSALEWNRADIAKRAFIRIRDIHRISFLSIIDQDLVNNRIENGEDRRKFVKAAIHSFHGKYQAAARLYTECRSVEKAMEMFTDLRQFNEAKQWVEEYRK